MSKEKSGRGGVRAGAGRKPKPATERARRITITLPPELVAVAESIGGGNQIRKRSAGIAAALELWQSYNPPAAPARVELWRALDGGALYAVLVERGICINAAGPLDPQEAEAVRGGDTAILIWDGPLSDEIAEREDTGHHYERVWPPAN
jgi:hypothetical protein